FDGNVRELENVVQRMLFNKVDGNSFSRADWLCQQPPSIGASREDEALEHAASLLWRAMLSQGLSFSELMRRIEHALLQKALQMRGKPRRELAGRLNTSEQPLYQKTGPPRTPDSYSRRAKKIS